MTQYTVGDKVACALCCGGRHTPVPANLLGTIIAVIMSDSPTYMVRLPSGMIDMLRDNTARSEKSDPTQTAKMRHALGA